MPPWRPLGLFALVALASVTVLPCQRWHVARYDTAQFHRATRSTSRVVDPAPAGIVAAARPVDAAASKGAKPAVVRGTEPAVVAGTEPAVKNLVPNGSFEEPRGRSPAKWGKIVIAGAAKLAVAKKLGHSGGQSILINAKGGADAAWYCIVEVEAHTWYRLSGWIRTRDVDRGAGAELNVHQFGEGVRTEAVRGDTEWKQVAVEFDSKGHEKLRIDCLLGGWRRTRGRAWFDDVRLVRVDRPVTSNPVDLAVFSRPRRPAQLRGGELDRRRQFVKRAPADLRDLAAYIAFDMRRAGRAVMVRKQALKLPGIAPIWLEVQYLAPDLEGSQRVKARVRPRRVPWKRPPKEVDATKANAKKGPGKRKPKSSGRGVPELRVAGEIRLTRRIGDQRIDAFKSELRLDVEVPPGFAALPGARRCRVEHFEDWKFHRVDGPESSAFHARVHHAIRTGARHLREQAARRPGNGGRLALTILTLIKAGEDPRDPLLKKLLARLRKSILKKTYDCAVAIMAIESLYAPAGERDAIISGRLRGPVPRRPDPADLELLEEWTAILRGNLDQRTDPGYLQRWNYTPAKRFDNSNSQYAMLGLYTASLCGVEIPATVWFSAANHWLKSQAPVRDEEMGLELTSYQDALEDAKRGDRRTVTRGALLRPRGWGYTSRSPKSSTGSMTTAGITGLVICEAALRDKNKGTAELRSDMRDAIRSGFAWLVRNFSVAKNPHGNARWHYYYLYGLERACELNHTKLLNDRRWYFEGAELLMRRQKPDGSWRDVTDTCFAILFLKKAAPPVTTGPR